MNIISAGTQGVTALGHAEVREPVARTSSTGTDFVSVEIEVPGLVQGFPLGQVFFPRPGEATEALLKRAREALPAGRSLVAIQLIPILRARRGATKDAIEAARAAVYPQLALGTVTVGEGRVKALLAEVQAAVGG